MADMNYIGSVVKILEKPIEIISNNKILRAECRVQLVQIRNIQIVHLVFWENLAHDIINNYQLNDYMMVEGYLSFPIQTNNKLTKGAFKKAQITVLKVYSI